MNTVEQYKKESWRLHPSLDFDELFPPAVLFSIFETDPRPRFKEHMKNGVAQMEKQSPGSSAADLQDVKQARLSASWDWLFHDIPGNEVTLLMPTHPHATMMPHFHADGQLQAPMYSVMIGSNSSPGTKWLVTRATRYKQRPVCWCLPVTVEIGKVSEVSLSRGNMTELEIL